MRRWKVDADRQSSRQEQVGTADLWEECARQAEGVLDEKHDVLWFDKVNEVQDYLLCVVLPALGDRVVTGQDLQ